MLDEETRKSLEGYKRTTTIIVFALCTGVIVFGIISLFVRDPAEPRELGMVTLVLYAFIVMEGMAYFIVPRIILATSRKQIAAGTWQPQGGNASKFDADELKLAAVFQSTTIIKCALMEGIAFFALIAHILEGHISTIVIAGLLLLGIASRAPLGDRLERWIEDQMRLIEDEQHLSPLE